MSTVTRALLLIAATMTAGCQQGAATRALEPRAAASTHPAMARLQAQARAAADDQVRQAGVALAEARVQAQPEDLEARRLLAQVYLASGRFRSAAQAYDDALALAPGDETLRLKKALALLAQGNSVAAIGELDRIAQTPDAGLAYALAGQATRGVELLAQAARAPDATPRIRQNLALAYALSGQWARAKVVAGQDLAPAAVEARLRGWAMLAAAADPAVQTASLLAVTPDAGDAGRPIGLAYIPPAARLTQVADASPPAAAVPAAVVPAAVAAVAAVPPPASAAAVAPSTRPAKRKPASPLAGIEAAPRDALRRISAPAPDLAGRQWVVQLGAYDRPDLRESNWQRLQRRAAGLLDGYVPTRTEKRVGERRYYRLSIAGFEARGDAVELCEALQAKGRDCFVRRVSVPLPAPTRA